MGAHDGNASSGCLLPCFVLEGESQPRPVHFSSVTLIMSSYVIIDIEPSGGSKGA